MPFIDVLNGFTGAANEHNTNLFNMQEERKKELSTAYSKIVDDPTTPDEVRQEASQRMLGLHTLEPGKKIPKEWEQFSFVVQPKTPAPTPLEPPKASVPALQSTMTTPPPVTAPTPPPQTMNMGMKIPYDEQTRMIASRDKAEADAKYHPAADNAIDEFQFYLGAAKGDYNLAREMRNKDKVAAQKGSAFNFQKPLQGSDLRGMLRQSGQPEMDAGGQPIDDSGFYNVRHDGASLIATPDSPRFGPAQFGYVPSLGQWVSYQQDQRGNSRIVQQLGGTEMVPPAGAPVSSVQNKIEMVPQQDGTIKAVPIQNSTQTQRGAGAPQAAAPSPTAPPTASVPTPTPPGATVGGKSLTPDQVMETSKKTEAYSNTVDRMVGILGKMANMEPLLARGKAHIMADPSGIAKIAFSNLYTPTDSEAKFAADYASLGEDINILRGAFGATGFRSSEAFNQLMNQRGNLLGNPKVFKETLQNSLQSVISQLIPMKKAIEKSGVPMPVTDGILQAYTILNNGDEKKIVAAMKKDGWIGGK